MADILIRGIPKPTDCGKCFVGDRTMCVDGCPLHELPEHGDLIDRSELKTNMIDDTFGSAARYVNLVQILDAPVIVPSNKEDLHTMDEFMCGQECGNPEDGSL